ncbi:DUF4439 domain-containing protein [Arthrobacter sp. AD-310]
MNDDNQENRPRIGPFRYVVLGLAALLVLSLGFALIPADPPVPAPPPFTEQARAAAFDDAMELRAAARQLGAGAGAGAASPSVQPAVDEIVSLLTFQARALLAPNTPTSGAPTNAAPDNGAAADSPTAPSTPPAQSATPSAAPIMAVPELAAALAASGSKRLKDAETADGGMARLLAGAGTAQVLAARGLAAAAGAPDPFPAVPDIPLPEIPVRGTSTSPAPETSPASGTTGTAAAQAACTAPASDTAAAPSATAAAAAAGPAGPGRVLAAVAAAEHEAVYAYQAAVVRLPPDAAGPASDFLRGHRELAEDAEVLTRRACGHLPPQQPGYVLTPAFLADPATGLARLEEGTLAVLGDAVAMTGGTSRAWALAALQAAAARAAHWGGDPGFLPGLALDPAELPGLPAATSPATKQAPPPAASASTDGP